MKGINTLLLGILFAGLATQAFATPIIQPGQPGNTVFKPPAVNHPSRPEANDGPTDRQERTRIFSPDEIREGPAGQTLAVARAFQFPEPGILVLMVIGLLSTVIGLIGTLSFLRRLGE